MSPTQFAVVRVTFVDNVMKRIHVLKVTTDEVEAKRFARGKVKVLPDCDIPNRSEYVVCEVIDVDEDNAHSEVRLKTVESSLKSA